MKTDSELRRGLVATAIGLALGLFARVFLRKDGGRAWRGKSAS